MKTTLGVASVMFACALVGDVPMARGDVINLSPIETLALPADTSGVSRVVFRFDFSGLPEGEGRRIDEAYVNWRLTGVATDEPSEFNAYVLATPWTPANVESLAVVAEQGDPIASWDIEPLDFTQGRGGILRLDLREMVRQWVDGSQENHGMVVATPDVSQETLAGQVSRARLTVMYGFVR